MTNQYERSPKQEFLIDSAIMLHRYGTPSHRLERVMAQVARSLDVEAVFLYTPTALVISLSEIGSAESTVVRQVQSGPVNVDKLIQFDKLLSRVEHSKLSIDDAMQELSRLGESHPGTTIWHRSGIFRGSAASGLCK